MKYNSTSAQSRKTSSFPVAGHTSLYSKASLKLTIHASQCMAGRSDVSPEMKW